MTAPLSPAEGAALAELAASAVRGRLSGERIIARLPAAPALRVHGASFVTLERRGALRGCVGTLEAVRPLHHDVVRNAVRAMCDPRLAPVTAEDWPDLDVKVSVLSRPEPVPATSRHELVAALRPGVDGLILTDGVRRATFLPAVWDKLADPERFVGALLRKGGWTSGDWPDGLIANRYGSAEFRDPAPRPALPA